MENSRLVCSKETYLCKGADKFAPGADGEWMCLSHARESWDSWKVKRAQELGKPVPQVVRVFGSKVTKSRGTRNAGIGDLAKKCILAGKDFEATKAEILKLVPTSKFSKACYSWYKAKVQK